MIKNKKGVIALIDAMIFLVLIAVIGTSLFAYSAINDSTEPMAKTVCDDLFSMELHACDVYDTEDTQIYPVSVLLAANMNTKNESYVNDYVSKILDELIPKIYGFDMELKFNNNVVHLERSSNRELTSEYSETIEISHTEGLNVSLKIY